MRTLLLGSFIALAVAHPAESADELTVKEISTARKIYVAKCAKCHRFYDPKDYSQPDWRKWMDAMERKSKLKTQDADALRRYLDCYRAGELPGKPQDKAAAK